MHTRQHLAKLAGAACGWPTRRRAAVIHAEQHLGGPEMAGRGSDELCDRDMSLRAIGQGGEKDPAIGLTENSRVGDHHLS